MITTKQKFSLTGFLKICQEHDLYPSSAMVLLCVYESQTGAVTPKELAAYTGMHLASLTGVTDRLVARDYIQRNPHPTDRRSSLLTLQPKAAELITRWVKPQASA